MQLRKKDRSNLMRVGLFVGGLTLVLCVMVVSIGKENAIFSSKVDIRARVGNVSALKAGSYVELKGIRIGTVTNISIISEDEVEIVMNVLADELKWVKEDSKVSISTAGLVGDKFVELYGGSAEAKKFNPEKDVLRAEAGTDFKKIISKGDTIATITERILAKLDAILTSLDDGNKIADTFNSLNKASHSLEKTLEELEKAKLGRTVENVNMSMERLNKASGSLERVLARVEKGPGTAHSLIYDDSVHEDLRALLGGAERNKVIKYFIRESIRNSEKRKR